MLTQNPDAAIVLSTGLFSLCLYPWLIQGLPNLISIFLSFLDDFGRRCAPGCNRIQRFCDRSCVYNGYNMYRLDPCFEENLPKSIICHSINPIFLVLGRCVPLSWYSTHYHYCFRNSLRVRALICCVAVRRSADRMQTHRYDKTSLHKTVHFPHKNKLSFLLTLY